MVKKIGLICSPGGHFVEILQLSEAFEGHSTFFLTYREETTAHRKNTHYIPNLSRNPFSLVLGVLKIFFILLKERPQVLFSTGGEIALPCFYIGKLLFRMKLIYMECSAQVFNPSLTGKWVYPITDLFLVQWKSLLEKYGPKATYAGGLI